MLCSYENTGTHLKVVRVNRGKACWLERVLQPQQSILFEVVPDTFLEVYDAEIAHSVLSARIPCIQLQIAQPEPLPV